MREALRRAELELAIGDALQAHMPRPATEVLGRMVDALDGVSASVRVDVNGYALPAPELVQQLRWIASAIAPAKRTQAGGDVKQFELSLPGCRAVDVQRLRDVVRFEMHTDAMTLIFDAAPADARLVADAIIDACNAGSGSAGKHAAGFEPCGDMLGDVAGTACVLPQGHTGKHAANGFEWTGIVRSSAPEPK